MNSRMEKPKTKDNDSKLFWPKKVLKILNFNADCFIRWRLRWCYHRHPLLRLTAVYTGQTHLQLVVQELPPKEALTLQGKISLRKPLAIKFNLDLCGLANLFGHPQQSLYSGTWASSRSFGRGQSARHNTGEFSFNAIGEVNDDITFDSRNCRSRNRPGGTTTPLPPCPSPCHASNRSHPD